MNLPRFCWLVCCCQLLSYRFWGCYSRNLWFTSSYLQYIRGSKPLDQPALSSTCYQLKIRLTGCTSGVPSQWVSSPQRIELRPVWACCNLDLLLNDEIDKQQFHGALQKVDLWCVHNFNSVMTPAEFLSELTDYNIFCVDERACSA